MRLKLLTIITVFAALGIFVLSFLFIPSQKDIALMYYYDKRYQLAKENYLALYNAGDKSISVVMPLVWSELELAQVDQAIVLIEEFVTTHSNSLEAKSYLGKNLKDTSRWQDYLQVLQELWQLHPNVDLLRIQEGILNHFGDKESRMKILEQIIKTDLAEEKDFTHLSYQLAQQKQFKEAVDVLKILLAKKQVKQLKPDTVELAVALLSFNGQERKAFELARGYLLAHPKDEVAIHLAVAVDSPKWGLKILQVLPYRLRNKKAILETKTSLMWEAGLEKRLYQELKAHFLKETLPESLFSTFLYFSLIEKEKYILEKLANKKYQGFLSDVEWMRLAVFYPAVVKKIQAFMPEDYYPLSLITNFEEQPSEIEADHIADYSVEALTDEEKSLYAYALAKRGYPSLAKDVLKKMSTIEEDKILDLAFELELDEWLLTILNPNSPKWLLAASATGKKDQVLHFLEKHPNLSESDLEMAYWAAKNRKENDLAHIFATKLYKKKITPLYKRYLASTLLAMERPKEALRFFEELFVEEEKLDLEYIQTLLILDEKEKVKDLIEDHSFSRKELIDLAFILADHEMKEEASQYFLQLATGEDKYKFLRQVLDLGKGEYIIGQIEKEELKEDVVADLYLEAAIQAKEEAKFKDAIAYLIPEENRFGRIKKFGRLAEQQKDNEVTKEIYAKALTIDPQDSDSLKFLGLEAYRKGQERQAKKYLSSLLSTSKGDSEVFVVYAELFDDKRWLKRALLETIEDPLQIASIYAKLDCKRKAENIYLSLGEKANVAYAHFLLDQERNGAARSLLTTKTLDEKLALLRYYRQTFKFYHAIHLSNQLITLYPNNSLVWVARADLQHQLERRKEAIYSYHQALLLEPANERYKKAIHELKEPDLPFLALEGEWRQTGRTKFERFVRTGYHASPWDIRFEVDWVKINKYASPTTGLITPVQKVPWQGEVDWYRENCRGNKVYAKWFFGTGIMGAGTEIKATDRFGATELLAEYHRPNWDFDQTLIDNGSRDLLGILREGKLNPWASFRLDAAINRYNLKAVTNAATTWSIDGVLSFRLTTTDSPYYLSANVIVDTENAITTREINDIEPLAFHNREEYGLSLFFRKEWKLANLSFYGGALYDRQEGTRVAPIYGADITFGKKEKLQGTIHYSHSVDTSSTGVPVDSVIFRLEKFL